MRIFAGDARPMPGVWDAIYRCDNVIRCSAAMMTSILSILFFTASIQRGVADGPVRVVPGHVVAEELAPVVPGHNEVLKMLDAELAEAEKRLADLSGPEA